MRRAARALDIAAELGVSDHVLVTLHRPGLVDHPDRLLEVMRVLEDVALERPVVFPVHPRTARMLDSAGWSCAASACSTPRAICGSFR